MNKNEQDSLFVDSQIPQKSTHWQQENLPMDSPVDIEELLNFMGIIASSSKKSHIDMMKSLVGRALESLANGHMASFESEDKIQQICEILQNQGWGDIFAEEAKEDFSPTQKLLVLVTSTARRGAYIYLQKQWNTYLNLRRQIEKRGALSNNSCSQTNVSIPLDFFNPAQREAIIGALNSSFSLVLGGPGTGKTTVASAIVQQIYYQNSQAKITLLSPTGRAGARLKQSLEMQWTKRSLTSLLEMLKDELTPKTIHRFLMEQEGLVDSQFPWDEKAFPRLDWVIIDEISMVSPFLFSELMRVLSPETRIILLGDPHQLPSVSEGFLLGYFLNSPNDKLFSIFYLYELMRAENQNLQNTILHLQDQFSSSSAYTTSFLHLPEVENLSWKDFEDPVKFSSRDNGVFFLEMLREDKETLNKVLEVYTKEYFLPKEIKSQFSESPQQIFEIFFRSQLLCPTKWGIFGINYINEVCKAILKSQKQREYRPVIVEKNQSILDLYNGDLGVLWEKKPQNLVTFPGISSYRFYNAKRITALQDCFAMTVHKAQGSEFQNIFLFLPSYAIEQILSREIFYTAISRAKKKVIIISRRNILDAVLRHKNIRENALPLF